MRKDEWMQWWNDLADAHGLAQIKVINRVRMSRLEARLRDDPRFTDTVERELAERSQWARDTQFPSFDQVLQESTFIKLAEGFYRERGENGGARKSRDWKNSRYWQPGRSVEVLARLESRERALGRPLSAEEVRQEILGE